MSNLIYINLSFTHVGGDITWKIVIILIWPPLINDNISDLAYIIYQVSSTTHFKSEKKIILSSQTTTN